MRTRVVAIGVSHWHSLYDSAYLRHLAGMPDMELVGLHDESGDIATARAAVLGRPPVFTDYREMLDRVRPDFVIALGRHRRMAEVAHYLIDHRQPFLMEKTHGGQRRRGSRAGREGGGDQRVRRRPADPALPAVRCARASAAGGRSVRSAVTHLLPPEPPDLRPLPRMGCGVDARSEGGRR